MRIDPKSALLIALVTVSTVAGCQGDNPQGAKSADERVIGESKTVAEVNGVAITEEDLRYFQSKKQTAQPDAQQDSNAALNELVDLELLRQQAEKAGVLQRKEVIQELKRQRTNVLVNTYVRERIEDMSFTDEELRKEYEQQVAQLSKKEYKARHILSDTEAEGQAIIKELDSGVDFVELAKKRSTGPSAVQGGDLGWFKPNSMVPPFAEAVQKMDKGQYSTAPVQTQFGWHVILLEDSRDVMPPSFDEVKDKLKGILTNKAIQAYIDELRSAANIQIN